MILSESEIAAVANDAFRSGNPLVRRRAFDQLLSNLTAENAQDMLVHLKENRVDGEQWRDFHYLWGSLMGKMRSIILSIQRSGICPTQWQDGPPAIRMQQLTTSTICRKKTEDPFAIYRRPW